MSFEDKLISNNSNKRKQFINKTKQMLFSLLFEAVKFFFSLSLFVFLFKNTHDAFIILICIFIKLIKTSYQMVKLKKKINELYFEDLVDLTTKLYLNQWINKASPNFQLSRYTLLVYMYYCIPRFYLDRATYTILPLYHYSLASVLQYLFTFSRMHKCKVAYLIFVMLWLNFNLFFCWTCN